MKNSFKKDPRYRLELASRLLPKDSKRILDFGCGWGELAGYLSNKNKYTVYGYEPDPEKIKHLKVKYRKLKVIPLLKNRKLPIKDNSLDVAFLLEVLEHVPNERVVLAEIYRVLKNGGVFFLSVPHKGMTEIFDPGNLKFRTPLLHKFLYKVIFRQKNYEQKYLSTNFIGDVTRYERMWHKHYSEDMLANLVSKKFRIEKVYYYGLCFPLLSMISQCYQWVFKKKLKIIEKILLLDSRHDYKKLSYFIFIKALKYEK